MLLPSVVDTELLVTIGITQLLVFVNKDVLWETVTSGVVVGGVELERVKELVDLTIVELFIVLGMYVEEGEAGEVL